jgi:hypothetical protein
MYSVALFKLRERLLRDSFPSWPHWSYDAYFLEAQFALWVIHWLDPQSSGGLSVKTYALLLLNFGIITVVYYGKGGIARALFIVTAMECALWSAYQLATAIRNRRITTLIWILMSLTPCIVSLLRYNLVSMDRAAAKGLLKDTIKSNLPKIFMYLVAQVCQNSYM